MHALPRIVVRKRAAAAQRWPVRIGPKRKILEHGRVYIRDLHAPDNPLPRLRIGHHAHTAERKRLPEALIVAEQKQLVLFDRATERATKLIPPKRRNARLIEEIP